MKKLVATLGATTIALAGSTVYLAHQLGIEREHAVALEMAAKARGVGAPAACSSASDPAGTKLLAASAAVSAATTSSAPSAVCAPAKESRLSMSSVREALARDALAQYSDPARRAILLARARAEVHRPLAGVAKEVALTAEEESRLLDLLAAQSLKVQEDAARCNFDWSLDCSGKRLARDQEEAKQEQRALLGPERFERFENFRDSYAERQQVRELQDRLAGNQRLSDDQNQQLAGMLLEERRKFADEVKQRGEGVGSFATESGQILTVVASAGPDRDAKWLQSGEEFSRRMRERAAVVLTSGQMKAYEQMQEELMSVLRDNARRQAILDTAPQPAETRR